MRNSYRFTVSQLGITKPLNETKAVIESPTLFKISIQNRINSLLVMAS